MKKYLSKIMVMVLCFVLLLSGCGTNPTTATNSKASVTPTVEVTEKPTVTPTTDSKIASTEVYVFIAASLSNAMKEISDMYHETQPNVKITYNADSSGTLMTQIQEGAKCDLFFSAASKQITTLEQGGLIEPNTSVDLLKNKVVLIKPRDGKTDVTGFDNVFKAKNIALAAEGVPAGDYARDIFNNLKIWDKVSKMEINEGSNVTAVLTAVSEGSNEVGVVYESDAESLKDSVEIIATAPESSLSKPVIYPIAQVINKEADDTQKQAAKDFLTFLSTDKVLKVFEKYGFTINQ